MSKYFKHYYILIITIGILLFVLAGLSYPLAIDNLWIILLCFSVITEILRIPYSQNKYLSLMGPLSIVSLTYMNLTSTLFLIVCMHTILNTLGRYCYKHIDKFFNKKYFFNIFCMSICTASAYLISKITYSFDSDYTFVLTLLLMVSIHTVMNYSLVNIVVYLYTGDREDSTFKVNQIAIYIFYSLLISLFLIASYEDYGFLGLFCMYIFIASFQTNMLTSVIGGQLHKQLNTDTLTSAYNRNYLDKIITDKINEKIPFTILFLDFDKFKQINDSYGHLVGDKILVHFVKLLKRQLDDSNKLFRYGGDEFCIILKNPKDKDHILDKLNKARDNYKIIHKDETIPYGFTIADYTYTGKEDIKSYQLLEYVDKLMYEGKDKSNIFHSV